MSDSISDRLQQVLAAPATSPRLVNSQVADLSSLQDLLIGNGGGPHCWPVILWVLWRSVSYPSSFNVLRKIIHSNPQEHEDLWSWDDEDENWLKLRTNVASRSQSGSLTWISKYPGSWRGLLEQPSMVEWAIMEKSTRVRRRTRRGPLGESDEAGRLRLSYDIKLRLGALVGVFLGLPAGQTELRWRLRVDMTALAGGLRSPWLFPLIEGFGDEENLTRYLNLENDSLQFLRPAGRDGPNWQPASLCHLLASLTPDPSFSVSTSTTKWLDSNKMMIHESVWQSVEGSTMDVFETCWIIRRNKIPLVCTDTDYIEYC